MLVQRGHPRAHADDRLAEQEMDQIGLVNAEIGERAHCRALFIEKPRIRRARPVFGTRMPERRMERQHAPDRAVLNQPPRLLMRAVEALIVADHQKPVRLFRRRDHRLAFGKRRRHRLFAEHVPSRFERANRVLRVRAVRAANADRIDAFDQRLNAFKRAPAVFLSERLRAFRNKIIKSPDFAARILRIFRRMAHLGNFSASDDADSQRKPSS